MRPADHRQRVVVALPCSTCAHHGVCTIEEQIESDLVLVVEGVGRPVRLTLSCSVYAAVTERPPAMRVTRTIAPSPKRRGAANARRAQSDAEPKRPRSGWSMPPEQREAISRAQRARHAQRRQAAK